MGEEPINLKKGFFKKVGYSITKIEKYPELATEGVGRAFNYLLKLVAILAIVVCLGMIYQTNQMLKEATNYLQNEFPSFSYQEGILQVDTQENIVIENEESPIGKVIVDTKETNEETLNGYIHQITEAGNGVIVLKDKLILKNSSVGGTINYNYAEMLGQMGLTQFNKEQVIQYVQSNQIMSLYFSLLITIFVYAFIMYFINTILYVFMISIFGYLANVMARIKMRYAAIFNMTIYAITLSTILNILYIGVNVFFNFNIEYFEVMYVSVAVIYLVAAIFILKSELIRRQTEVAKIVEVQKIVEKEQEEKNKQPQEKEKKKDKEEKDKEKKKDHTGEEPEGSNA